MKRMLILLFALLLMLSFALADPPAYSTEVAALKSAVHAMYEQYGFTPDTLGVFTPQVTVLQEEIRVHFRAYFLPASRLGEYEVVITNEEVRLTWTHDGADLSAWQPGDPECPVWGPAQIQLYHDQGIGTRDGWIKAYYAEGEEPRDSPSTLWEDMGLTVAPLRSTDMTSKEARSIAHEALKDVYGLTAADIDMLDWFTDEEAIVAADGRRFRELTAADATKGFHFLINAETGKVFHITLFAGGNG